MSRLGEMKKLAGIEGSNERDVLEERIIVRDALSKLREVRAEADAAIDQLYDYDSDAVLTAKADKAIDVIFKASDKLHEIVKDGTQRAWIVE